MEESKEQGPSRKAGKRSGAGRSRQYPSPSIERVEGDGVAPSSTTGGDVDQPAAARRSPSQAFYREISMGGKRGTKARRRRRAQLARAVAGIDAGKFQHAMVVRPHGGEDSKPLYFDVTREGFEKALAFLQKQAGPGLPGEVIVGIEFAGNCGFTLAHFLDQAGYVVVSVPPVNTKRWKDVEHGGPLKTDGKDALAITDLVATGRFVGFPFLHPRHVELRQMVSAVERMTLLRSGAITRLRAVLHVAWPEFEKLFGSLSTKVTPLAVLEAFPGPDAVLKAGVEEVTRVLKASSRGQLGGSLAEQLVTSASTSLAIPTARSAGECEIPLLVAQIQTLRQQREFVEERMVVAMAGLDEAPALLSVPGVGQLTAAVFLGSVGDAGAYESAEQVLRLAGLNLVEDSSGLRRGRKKISKRGRAVMRRQLYLLAMRQILKTGLFRPYYDGLIGRGYHHKAALIGVARRLLRILFAVARSRKPFDVERLRQRPRGE